MAAGLSIRQPWVELILQGRKTIEVRTWTTNYRGQLWLHAGRRIDVVACKANDVSPLHLPRGAVVGVCDLHDCFEFDEQSWIELRSQHFNYEKPARRCFGWILQNPLRVTPTAYRGRLGLMKLDANFRAI